MESVLFFGIQNRFFSFEEKKWVWPLRREARPSQGWSALPMR